MVWYYVCWHIGKFVAIQDLIVHLDVLMQRELTQQSKIEMIFLDR